MNAKIVFDPTERELQEVENWLKQEYEDTGEGFYCNWSIIKESLAQKELITISLDKHTVGFLVLGCRELRATIDILEIRTDHRNKGLGKELVDAVFEHLRADNIYAVDVQCSPSSSEPFWRKLGFRDFPKDRNRTNAGNTELFKVLVHCLKCSTKIPNLNREYLDLWNSEPGHTLNASPTWTWSLKFKKGSRELEKPIVHPSNRDWRVRWRMGDTVIKDDKVKYFDETEIDFGKFIVLRNLPEIPT